MTTITDKLAEAIELVEDAMAYVPEYFANKHGMNRRMAAMKDEFAAYASQQGEPSSGSNAAAPVVVEPSDARVEAAAKAIADVSEAGWLTLEERHQDEYRSEARAVLKAADAVSPSTRPADASNSGAEIDGSGAVSAGAGWMPIETAPKDGTLIVLGARNGVWLGKYCPVYPSGYRPENPWSSMLMNHDHMAERHTRPTHWMPLPAAPGSERKEGANG